MTIRAVFFDLGRVLVHFDHMQACSKFASMANNQLSAERVFKLLYGGDIEDGYERGRTDAWFAGEVRRALTLPHVSQSDIVTIWGDVFSPIEEVDALVGEVRAAMPVLGIISNTTAPHWEWIKKCIPRALEHIPRANRVLSFEAKARKPEQAIYRSAIERAGCDPQEMLFIDDKKENLAGAEACGIQTLAFDARSESISDLRIKLRARGVLT